MAPQPQELSVEEYRELRATIRERGSVRLFVALITFVTWAALTVAIQSWLSATWFSLLPLLVLAAGFETILSLHVGVERIGRFIQVFYEGDAGGLPGWEHAAMDAKPRVPALRIDPLFSSLFLVATVLNLVLALLVRVTGDVNEVALWVELVGFSFVHAILVARVLAARRFARSQREVDLETYRRYARALKPSGSN
ncbi:MAG TPA: hypothetical protein VFV98_02435 [Vicinamibacterales bacterium]|nr:hypothetical protein [Vicinamibacterales bacterium]